MPDLALALREVVDTSAEPVTVEEVLGLPVASPSRRTRWPLMLAAAGLVLAAGVAGVMLSRDSGTPEVTTATTAAGIAVPPLSSCERRIDRPGMGCLVSDAQAEEMLGIPINQPDGIPDGWELVYHHVRYWTAEQPAVADYNRAWFRDPPDTTADPCGDGDSCLPDYVQVNVRSLVEGERLPVSPEDRLLDGSPYIGSGDESPQVTWIANGRYYRLRSHGIDFETALEIANSLA